MAENLISEGDTMDIEFEIESGTRLVKIPVHVNGYGPFQFVFDTGASTTTLTKSLAEKLGISTYKREQSDARGLGSGIPTEYAIATIGIGPLTFNEDEVYVLDLNAMLQGAGKRDGVIGHSTLKHCILSLNYSRKKLCIDKDRFSDNDSTDSIIWSPFEYIKDSHLIGVPVVVNGCGPFDFVLDTGAGNTVLTPDFATNIGASAEPINGIARGLGGDVELKIASLDSISIGSQRLEKSTATVIDLSRVSPKGNLIENGIIGFDFLKSLEIIIDYPRMQFALLTS
ncbi:MAG: aspartyl protease family protein [Candidatus Thorarchaeota archaeon]|nr:aspartyl protease family protein [Candidatus Thorarchaeota archaeon]